MPDTIRRNQSEIDEFDLHDLAALAPVQLDGSHRLDAVVPDWDLRRDELLPQSPASRRSPWTAWLAGAAAAAVLVGAGAWGVSRPHPGIPAAPLTTASPSAKSATMNGNRVIGPGHYLRRRVSLMTRGPASHGAKAETSTRTDVLSSDGRVWLWLNRQPSVTGDPWPRPDLGAVPTDPAALYAWLAAGHGSTATPAPQTPGATASTAVPPSATAWSTCETLLTDLGTSAELRRALVRAAARIPDTSVTREGSDTVLVHRTSFPDDVGTGTVHLSTTLRVGGTTLDLRRVTSDQAVTTARGTTTNVWHTDERFDPVEDLTGQPGA